MMSPDSSIVVPSRIEEAVPVTFRQTWLPENDPGFLAGVVRVARDSDMLIVAAELPDEHVFTEVRPGIPWLWELGDVFEIFLFRPGDDFYSELHVAPDGRTAHLRIPLDRAADLRSGAAGPADFVTDASCFTAVAKTEPPGWKVMAHIPVGAISRGGPIVPGEQWRASFCRYDADPHRPSPILSSTSSLVRENFHEIACWNRLCF